MRVLCLTPIDSRNVLSSIGYVHFLCDVAETRKYCGFFLCKCASVVPWFLMCCFVWSGQSLNDYRRCIHSLAVSAQSVRDFSDDMQITSPSPLLQLSVTSILPLFYISVSPSFTFPLPFLRLSLASRLYFETDIVETSGLLLLEDPFTVLTRQSRLEPCRNLDLSHMTPTVECGRHFHRKVRPRSVAGSRYCENS